MTAKVTFIGDERMISHLHDIVLDFERPQTARPAARMLRTEMRSRVRYVSGHLHDDIDIRHTADNHLMVGVSRDGFYGYFLEHGTIYAAAYPWFRPAIDATRQSATAAVRREVEQTIQRVWGS